MAWLLTALLCILLVELALRLPFGAALHAIARTGARAMRTVRASAVSDHWKEKAMGAYARATFLASLKLAALIALLLGVALALAYLFDFGVDGYHDFLFGAVGLAASAGLATAYAFVRSGTRGANGYGFADRLLHRLALGVRPVAELSFDLDQKAAGTTPAPTDDGRHVFVSGLARAGTTILMRRLHASGAFASLTYRDMPFVLAPNLWGKAAAGRARDGGEAAERAPKERAHGDGIRVDADSPESLDEVFWRTFDREGYIARDHLAPHTPDAETSAKYVAYVRAILAAKGGERYLSKANNDILRLTSIRRMFPDALLLVPFRAPAAHAASLMRQHENFCRQQREDRFVRAYMTWLGHHEFGLDHRPFRFDDAGPPPHSPETLDYWLDLWVRTYAWLERTAPDDAVFVSYEDLCADPAVWLGIAELAGVEPEGDPKSGEAPFVASARVLDADADPELIARAEALHARLKDRAAAALERNPI